MTVYAVVDEDGVVIKTFQSKANAQKFADKNNEDRDPLTMEYFVKPVNVK